MARFGMFRNAPVIKVALVPATPTLEPVGLCDMPAIRTRMEDQR